MKNYVFAGAIAIAFAATLGAAQIAAQQQAGTPTTPAMQSTAGPQDETATTKLVGCLYREQDVPGRQPNVAERAGVMEDYILADATIAEEPGTPTGTSGTAPAAGKMFKVEKIADEQLRALVGKRVEVTGKIDAEKGDVKGTRGSTSPQVNKSPGPDRIELPQFEAVSIREVSGTCPSKPSGRQ